MSVGVNLSTEDLQAVAKLYAVRWGANIKNWKERDTDYCLWLISCPDQCGSWVTRTGFSLAETIIDLLKELDL